jgi:hypothetical protein
VVLVSLIVFAPLGLYFLNHPGNFSQRIAQTNVLTAEPDPATGQEALLNQLVKTLLVFGFRGDNEPFSTIPYRPALNLFFSFLLLAGIVLSVLRIKQPNRSFLITWLIIMILPAIFAGQGPSAKRAIGALPAVACLIAVGVLDLWAVLAHRLQKRPEIWLKVTRAIYAGLILSGFVYSGFLSHRDYFVVWASNPNLFTHFEAGVSAIGEYVGTLPPGERIYVSPDLPRHPGILYHSELREGIRGYNGRVCLVAPAQTPSSTTYVIAPSKDKNGLQRLQTHFPQGQIVHDGPLHYGEPYFRAYRVPANTDAHISPSVPVSMQWAENIELLGYDLDAPAYHAGEKTRATLYYRGLAPMDHNYTAFVHLLGPTNPATGGPLWAQDDSEPCRTFYPTSVWDVGEIVIDTFTLELPQDIPPGQYTLLTGFYDLNTLERLPITRGLSQHNVGTLGQIQILDHTD